jgi:hypothetical protein
VTGIAGSIAHTPLRCNPGALAHEKPAESKDNAAVRQLYTQARAELTRASGRRKLNVHCPLSGDDRDRTGNLLVANQALSQLSYVPILRKAVETFGPEQGGISRPAPNKLDVGVSKAYFEVR